jgi:hypothetical protein
MSDGMARYPVCEECGGSTFVSDEVDCGDLVCVEGCDAGVTCGNLCCDKCGNPVTQPGENVCNFCALLDWSGAEDARAPHPDDEDLLVSARHFDVSPGPEAEV